MLAGFVNLMQEHLLGPVRFIDPTQQRWVHLLGSSIEPKSTCWVLLGLVRFDYWVRRSNLAGTIGKCLGLQKVKGNEEEEEVVAGFDFKPSAPLGSINPVTIGVQKNPIMLGSFEPIFQTQQKKNWKGLDLVLGEG
ncbi:hypothetical protein SLEP1_g34307 [Rubroshorea leprosula]|uniref:Uncharacterized protein n=1 Tax=Rubroshorea leprosula TaxID=152421 RepID=A0AAV5KJM3_9ROSI|nr:hypothetical protein SLEP1_g34307 [Rubroshorea leprosula]